MFDFPCSGAGSTDAMREGTPEQAILSAVSFCQMPAKLRVCSACHELVVLELVSRKQSFGEA